MLSALASLTPFSDYNQSPRNMYQCQVNYQLQFLLTHKNDISYSVTEFLRTHHHLCHYLQAKYNSVLMSIRTNANCFAFCILLFTYCDIKGGFHLKECMLSYPRLPSTQIKFDWSGDYRSMEKFKPSELLNLPIRSGIAVRGSTFEPTMHAQTLADSAESLHSFEWKLAFKFFGN